MVVPGHALRLRFQSTLSMRRATEFPFGVRQPFRISIHALHEESDRSIRPTRACSSRNFNPRSP